MMHSTKCGIGVVRLVPLMMVIAGLTLTACVNDCGSGHKNGPASSVPSGQEGEDPNQRVIERAASVLAKVSGDEGTWPPGTTFLAETEAVDDAVDLGSDLLAVTNGGDLKRISKGGTVTLVTQFPNAEIRRLAVVGSVAVVAVFPMRADGVGIQSKGELVAVPLGGGPNATVTADFDSSTYLAGARDGVWIAARDMIIERRDLRFARAEPRFVRQKVLDGGAAVRSIQNMVADDKAVVWGEHQMTQGPTEVFVMSASPATKTPKQLLKIESIGFDALALDARNLYFRADEQESHTDAIHALDRLSGGSYLQQQMKG